MLSNVCVERDAPLNSFQIKCPIMPQQLLHLPEAISNGRTCFTCRNNIKAHTNAPDQATKNAHEMIAGTTFEILRCAHRLACKGSAHEVRIENKIALQKPAAKIPLLSMDLPYQLQAY